MSAPSDSTRQMLTSVAICDE